MTLLLFLIILGALVFVHELGHFISAKRAGIRVDEFALGFPPRLFSVKKGETAYTLNLIPFGGYVKIHGEDGEEELLEHAGSAVDNERRLTAKPRYIQAIVLASGVLGNIVFAWFLISIGFLTGVPSSVEGRYREEVRHPELVITSTLDNSPAEEAGLMSGDVILSLTDGARTFTGTDAEAARAFISESAGALTVEYQRGEKKDTREVQPVEGIIPGKPAIGVTLDTVGTVRFGILRSFYEGLLTTLDLSREVAVGLFGFLRQAFLGQASLEAVTGPVGIAGMVGEARVLGFIYLLSFTAFISINLAVINLLPIPALDGGRLLFLAIEGVMRRPIPAKFTKAMNSTGFVLLILFMVFITYRDIVKLF